MTWMVSIQPPKAGVPPPSRTDQANPSRRSATISRDPVVSCPEAPDTRDTARTAARSGACMQPHNPQVVFHQRFTDLVEASGLSIREIRTVH